jgi:hypothetical protein
MQHPSDDEWGSEESAEHRAHCSICRTEHERLESALADFRELSRTAAERPEYFWDRQRLAIHGRLKPSHATRRYRAIWIWATAAALVVVLVLILNPNHTQSVVPDFAAGHDQELLVGIERSLNRELPQALQPVSILTQELDNAASRSTTK